MLTMLLLGQAGSADAALKRLDAYLAKADTLSVVVQSKYQNRLLGTTTLRVDRPSRLRLDAKFTGTESKFVLNERGGLEADTTTNLYERHFANGQIHIPPFSVAPALGYSIPMILVRGSSKGSMPGGAKPTSGGKATIAGVATDIVVGKFQDGGGRSEVKLWIDGAGRLLKVYAHSEGMQGSQTLEHAMSNYVANSKFPDAVFSTALPLGYAPFRLEPHNYGPEAGRPVANVNLRSAQSGNSSTLLGLSGGSNMLVVVADPAFHATPALIQAVQAQAKKVPNGRLIIISNARNAANAKKLSANAYFDPSGTELAKLGLPVLPAMLLLDKQGRLVQLFLGYDGKWDAFDEAVERLRKGG